MELFCPSYSLHCPLYHPCEPTTSATDSWNHQFTQIGQRCRGGTSRAPIFCTNWRLTDKLLLLASLCIKPHLAGDVAGFERDCDILEEVVSLHSSPAVCATLPAPTAVIPSFDHKALCRWNNSIRLAVRWRSVFKSFRKESGSESCVLIGTLKWNMKLGFTSLHSPYSTPTTSTSVPLTSMFALSQGHHGSLTEFLIRNLSQRAARQKVCWNLTTTRRCAWLCCWSCWRWRRREGDSR